MFGFVERFGGAEDDDGRRTRQLNQRQDDKILEAIQRNPKQRPFTPALPPMPMRSQQSSLGFPPR
jgi:hypothetical protein